MNVSHPSAAKGMFFLIMAQVLVAISIVSAKYLLASLPVLVVLTIRFSLAAIILLPLHWLSPAKHQSVYQHLSALSRKDWLFMLAQALSAGILFNALMLMGLHYTDANIAGIITSALPALIAVMSWLILKEGISRKTFACIILATLGLLVISLTKMQGAETNNSFFGDLLVLLSLFPEAAYYIFTKLHTNKLPIFLVASLINGINAFILIITALIVQPDFSNINHYHWLVLIFLGLTAGLFYVFWFFGAKQVEGVKASLATAVMPVATVIFAWALLNEQLSGIELVGMALVIASILIDGI
ncbi:MAG: DMT family transporter [Legionella sp.]|jgi:drug/metabolite transporter (DMT)-like permease